MHVVTNVNVVMITFTALVCLFLLTLFFSSIFENPSLCQLYLNYYATKTLLSYDYNQILLCSLIFEVTPLNICFYGLKISFNDIPSSVL